MTVAETRAGVSVAGVATLPVQDAPILQHATLCEESVEQVAVAGQQAPPSAALRVEQEL